MYVLRQKFLTTLLLLFTAFSAHGEQTGTIESDGLSKRYIWAKKLSTEANNKLTRGFLLRRDLWIKNRAEKFLTWHKSLPLKPSGEFAAKYNLVTRTVRNDEMVTVTKKQRTNNRHIVIFHGGGYIFAKTGLQKNEKAIGITMDYLGDRATYLDYPGVQTADYREITAVAQDAYIQLLNLYPNDEFIFVGNSAGANLALLTAQKLKGEGYPLPKKYIFISPSASVSIEDMRAYDFYDTILSIPFIKLAADKFGAGLPYDDPRAAPLYGSFEGLGDMAIFQGTYDILYPDSIKLYNKAKASGVRVHHYQYNKMWHDWMLYTKIPEAHLGWKQAAEFIKH